MSRMGLRDGQLCVAEACCKPNFLRDGRACGKITRRPRPVVTNVALLPWSAAGVCNRAIYLVSMR
jgi:hypothetical protein